VDLIHPHTTAEVAEVLRDATGRRRRLLVVGGRTHMDRGNPMPAPPDAELWTTQLDGLVAYDPAEMVCVVGAGMRVGELERILGEGGQEWPVDAPAEATVGGVVASAPSSARRLRFGPVRDSVLEVELVTGDGRLVRGGGRTVKNVTGYDLPRLAVGSLGVLGVIVQVALKVRPLPERRRTVRASGDGLRLGERLMGAVFGPAGIVATADGVELRLEGWHEEVERQTELGLDALGEDASPTAEVLDEVPFPSRMPWAGAPVVAEAGVIPSRLPDLAGAVEGPWGALSGVGLLWAGLASADGPLGRLREAAGELGGVAPVIRGPGGLGDHTVPAPAVHRRLKASFDPAGVLNPGRGWGGI
jgi:glycolate oxidase FAD binding subunit